ncbi:nucleoside-diphosphate sugar epimerase [Shewanella frigidimarina]|uniref:nucleoside-diphosphate sugar epimerase n=1 Tax=Shewanella frigidimarina TaxID=56812 RepID=UPI003D7B87FB
MIAAIIGATGLVGNTLLTRIIESEHYSKVLVIGRSAPNLVEHQFGAEKVQFICCQLGEIHELTLAEKVDHAFCCLGTTIKQAGSEEAFIQVDKLAVLAFAKLIQAQANPSLKFMVVTALGADAKSTVFYNRIKGEVELSLKALSLPVLNIFQPSLLLGPRDNGRFMEDIGQTLFGGLSFLFIGPLRKYQPINAQTVAELMYQVALKPQVAPTHQIITNAMMHRCHY